MRKKEKGGRRRRGKFISCGFGLLGEKWGGYTVGENCGESVLRKSFNYIFD